MASLRIQLRPNGVVVFGAGSRYLSHFERRESRTQKNQGLASIAEDAEPRRFRRLFERRRRGSLVIRADRR